MEVLLSAAYRRVARHLFTPFPLSRKLAIIRMLYEHYNNIVMEIVQGGVCYLAVLVPSTISFFVDIKQSKRHNTIGTI